MRLENQRIDHNQERQQEQSGTGSTEFHPGDLVVLKSGGPVMTVDRVLEDSKIQCVWFGSGGDGHRWGNRWGSLNYTAIRADALKLNRHPHLG